MEIIRIDNKENDIIMKLYGEKINFTIDELPVKLGRTKKDKIEKDFIQLTKDDASVSREHAIIYKNEVFFKKLYYSQIIMKLNV